MHKSACREAHECLWVMELERAESRRVALSSGLCLESNAISTWYICKCSSHSVVNKLLKNLNIIEVAVAQH